MCMLCFIASYAANVFRFRVGFKSDKTWEISKIRENRKIEIERAGSFHPRNRAKSGRLEEPPPFSSET